MRFVLKILSLLFLVNQGLAIAKPNCTIAISSQKINGEKLNIIFHTTLRNKKECITLAAMHQKNFTPDTVKVKQVRFGWNGEIKIRKNSGILAKVQKKKHGRKFH